MPDDSVSGLSLVGRFLCRIGRHDWQIWCVNMDGHQSYRKRRCARFCGVEGQAQPLRYFGGADGPWQVRKNPPCTHGVNGQPILACGACYEARKLVRA